MGSFLVYSPSISQVWFTENLKSQLMFTGHFKGQICCMVTDHYPRIVSLFLFFNYYFFPNVTCYLDGDSGRAGARMTGRVGEYVYEWLD